MGIALSVSAFGAVPTYFGSGTFTSATTGTCTAPFPANTQADDVALLVVETENQAISLSTANGFVQVTNSPQFAGTAATNPGNRIAVFWKRLAGGDAAPVSAGVGNHQTCQIHVFRGVQTSGDPWNVTAGGNDGAANDTSAVIPGATTTVAETLVVLIQGNSNNATVTTNCTNVGSAGGWTNANLTNLTERTDNSHTAGLGGGHCLATGEKTAAGAYANTTVTLSATSYKGAMSIALAPPTSQTYPVTAADSVGVSDFLEALVVPGGTGYFGYPWATGTDYPLAAGTQMTWWTSTNQTAASDGTLTNVYWFGRCLAADNLKVRVAVFEKGASFAESTLIAESDLVDYTGIAQTIGWHAIPISGNIQAGHDYLVVIGWSASGSARLRGVYVAWGDIAQRTGAPADLSFPSSLTGWTGTNAFRPDLYATYTFGSGPAIVAAADSVGLSDSLALKKNYALADSAGLGDTLAVKKIFSLSDSVALGDSISAIKLSSTLYPRTVSDSVTFADSGSALVTRPFSGDSAGIGDSIVAVKIGGAQFYPLTAEDSVALGDSIARAMVRAKTMADSAALGEALGLKLTHPIADGVAANDTIGRIITRRKAVSDSVALGDVLSRMASHPRSLSDGVTASDSIVRFITRVKTTNDGVTLAEVLTRSLKYSLADGTTISAALVPRSTRLKNESAGFGDTIAVSSTFKRSLSDTLSLSESISLSASGIVSQSDGTGIADSIARKAIFSRSIADGVTVADVIRKLVNRPRADGAGVADAIAAKKSAFRSMADGVGLSEAIVANASHPRSQTEGAGLSDAVAITTYRARNINDSSAFGDVITISVIRGTSSKKKVVVIS